MRVTFSSLQIRVKFSSTITFYSSSMLCFFKKVKSGFFLSWVVSLNKKLESNEEILTFFESLKEKYIKIFVYFDNNLLFHIFNLKFGFGSLVVSS